MGPAIGPAIGPAMGPAMGPAIGPIGQDRPGPGPIAPPLVPLSPAIGPPSPMNYVGRGGLPDPEPDTGVFGRTRNPWNFDHIEPPEFSECGICFENVKRRGERFGMLENCDHAFCLSCIRGWRREREQDKQNLRLCPVCRNESFYVIPSDTIILDADEKQKIIDQYKDEMGRIPCKLFDYGRGTCAFGSSCFYAHLNPDGTRYIPPPLKWMRGAEGSEVKSEVKLSDFFD